MRPLILFLLFGLLLLAACGGGEKLAGPLIEDPEAVALQPTDMPVDLVEAGEGGIHVTIEQACASAADATERQACIDRLNSWGRRDHYQVTYASTDPNTLVTGVFQITVGVSVYETLEGAHASYIYNVDRLKDLLKENPDTSLLQAETVGDESVAWVNNSTETLGNRDVPISSYVIDFRRGNTIVRIQAAIASALGSVDEALTWARRVDTRILRVSGWQTILGTPEPTATVGP
jgi:hypothetical protein